MPNAPQDDRLEGRDGDIWRDYCFSGLTQLSIARKYGLSQQRVGQIIASARADIPQKTVEELKAEHLEFLRHSHKIMAQHVNEALAPAYSNGKMMVDENGYPIRDAATRLAAMDRMLKIEDRMSKMLGLDAPLKADVTVSDAAERAAQAAATEAALRLHGGTDE